MHRKTIKPPPVELVRRYECKNVVDSCFFLEHCNSMFNMPKVKEIDKDRVLSDLRLQKMNNFIDQMKDFNHATDPEILKRMVVYQDIVNLDYEKEKRQVTKDYQKDVLNPLREVAKIEMRAGNKKKKDKI